MAQVQGVDKPGFHAHVFVWISRTKIEALE
jgi:hypothetical protein